VTRKIIRISDISGEEIPEGQGAIVLITFVDARRGARELHVTDAEAEKLGGRPVARGGADLIRPTSVSESQRKRRKKRSHVARYRVIWLDRRSNARRNAIRDDEKSACELALRLIDEGHGDVRYQRPDERRWTAVRPKRVTPKAPRPKRDVPFPPTAKAMKARRLNKDSEGKGGDALDRRLPGSFEGGKKR
jgi:hypothetical protein